MNPGERMKISTRKRTTTSLFAVSRTTIPDVRWCFSRLHDGMHWFFSSSNIVIMICRCGRHRSVATAELWSNTLTRNSRPTSTLRLHLSELDFWGNTCAGNCSVCSKQSLRVFQTHYDQVQAECLRSVPVPDSVTKWKRPRPVPSANFEKASDKGHSHIYRDEHESRNSGRTGRTTGELSR